MAIPGGMSTRVACIGRPGATKLAWLAAIVVIAASWASAQDDADCFMCHSDPGLIRMLPNGGALSMYVDKDLFTHSVHAANGCISCHSDITELPHEPRLARVDCGACHVEAEIYDTSLHAVAISEGSEDAASCADCHSKHDIRSSTDPLSPTSKRNQPMTCGKCHSDPELAKKHMISVANPRDAYLKSTHSREIIDGNGTAASCTDCHGTHDLLPAHVPDSPVYRMNIADTCGKCHEQAAQEFKESYHGQALYKGIKDAPSCIDCHGEHDIEGPDKPGSAVSVRQITRETCSRCHDDERVMTKYGVATMRQASYMDSYHGMASAAGSKVVANCSSCHSAHHILPASDERSSIHPDNIPQTCAQCHPGAGPNFAIGKVHIMPTDPGQRALGITRMVYLWLIAVLLGGMVLHNTLLMGRHMVLKLRHERRGRGTYKRFTKGQTIGHLVLTVSFVVLAITGFALRYPESWWARVIFFDHNAFELRSQIHRMAGAVLVAVAIVNLIYVLFTKGGRKELWALTIKWKDVKDVVHNLAFVVGLRKDEPRFDRYSYSEKMEYWGLWWGSVLMAVTGFCMWFANHFLQHFPKIWLDIAALIHFYEAWLAVGTIVIWHFYYMIFDPEAYPMNWSWVTGNITEDDFKRRHPVEYERVAREAAEGEGNQPAEGGPPAKEAAKDPMPADSWTTDHSTSADARGPADRR
jgi:formate dehydrogenase gamma subunit